LPVGEIGMIRGGVRHEAFWLSVPDVTNRQNVDVEGADLSFGATLFNATAVGYVNDNVEVFGGFSQGFSVADFARAVSDTTQTQASALQNGFQTVDNYEIGIRGDWGDVRGSLAGFYSESDNGTTFDPNLRIVQQPEHIWGVEADGDYRFHEQWGIGGTATWMQGRIDLDNDGDYDEDLPGTRIPPLKLTGYLEYQPFEWWNNRLQAMYSGTRSPDSSLYGNQPVEDYVLVDLYASFKVGPGELRLGVENLLNEDYYPVLNQATAASYNYTRGSGRKLSFVYSVNW
ncbi:MAG: TonB-dependent receptor, partial [Phycisphaeraceae bacterium]